MKNFLIAILLFVQPMNIECGIHSKLRSINKQLKWINIKERIPKCYEWVLVGYWDETDSLIYMVARYFPIIGFELWDVQNNDDRPRNLDTKFKLKNITHWLEIPQDIK